MDGSRTNTPALFLGDWAQLELAVSRRIGEMRGAGPLEPLAVVCGSGAAAAHLRRAVTRESGGLVLVDFTTIHRLAAGLAAGPEDGAPLADEVEALRVIARVLAEAPEGSYFERIKTMPGLPRALRRAFKDLREARVSPPRVAELEGEGSAQLAALYASFVRAMAASGRTDDAAMYEAAARRLDAAPGALSSAWVGLYGLYDLPDSQRRFVESLAAARPVDAFVPGPPDARYSEAARTLYEELGCRPEQLGRSARPDVSRDVRVVSVEDAAAERREVLRRVMAAAERGRRFHDIAVVHADAAWRGLFVESLEVRGIPVAAHVRRPTVAARSVMALLACVCPVFGPPLERSALVDLASACALLGRREPAEVALWDRLSRDARVVAGAGQWHVRLRALADRSSSTTGAVRDLLGFADRVEALRLAGLELGTWQALAGWLADAAVALGVPSDDPVPAVIRRLGRLSDIEPGVGLDSFAATVRDVVADQSERLGSPGRSGVTVAAPEQIRGLRFSLVLLGGLVEGLFPARPSPDPLLDDAARSRLVSDTGCRLSTVALRSDESDLLFALTCDAATDELVLLRARSSAGTGAPQLPSRHLVGLCRELSGRRLDIAAVDAAGEVDGRVTRVPASPVPHPGWPGEVPGVDQSDVDVGALGRLHAGGDKALTAAYLASVLGREAAVRRARSLRSRREPGLTAWDCLIPDPALAEHVLARGLSVSAVEDYLGCPFVFYTKHVLRAAAVEEPEESMEPSPLDLGMLAHAVLERVFSRLDGAGEHDIATALTLLEEAMDEVFGRGEAEGLTGHPLAWEGRRRRMARDLREAVVTDPQWKDDLRPVLFEWRFGSDEPGPVVEVRGRRLTFRGRVDRIDRDASGARVRLLDYKTGKGEAERRRLEAGEDIQLPVYRLAAAALSPPPAEVGCAFRLVTRAGGFRDLPLPGKIEATTAALRERLEGFVAGVEAGRFLRMHGGDRCRWCDLAYACGAHTPMDAQKQGAETPGGPADQGDA